MYPTTETDYRYQQTPRITVVCRPRIVAWQHRAIRGQVFSWNAAGEAPPECQVEKEVSNQKGARHQCCSRRLSGERKKVETGAFEHKFDAHVIGEFRNAFALLPKKKHRSTRVVKIKNALPHEVAVGALHCIKAAGDKQ